MTLHFLEFEQLKAEKGIKAGVAYRQPPQEMESIWEAFCPEAKGAHVRQVHGDRVVVAQADEAPEADGLMTNEPQLCLTIKHADCQPAIFYDPTLKVLASVHSGWRGSVQNIYHKTVEQMKQTYGVKPENLLVSIGPSLGPEKAEFIHYKTELPESFWKHQTALNHFDFWAISREQLTQAGVLDHHIEILGLCTYSDKENFYSYRRDKTRLRHYTLAALLP